MAEISSTTATAKVVVSTLGAQLEGAARCMIERLQQTGGYQHDRIREQITATYAFVSEVAASRPVADLSVITLQDYHQAVRRWQADGTSPEAISAIAARLHWFFEQFVEHEASPYPSPAPSRGDSDAEVV